MLRWVLGLVSSSSRVHRWYGPLVIIGLIGAAIYGLVATPAARMILGSIAFAVMLIILTRRIENSPPPKKGQIK